MQQYERGEGIIPSRQERFADVLSHLATLPAAHSSLEAYGQLSEAINAAEDRMFGVDSWAPPRTFLDGQRSERLYTIYTESFHHVDGFAGVTLMIAKRELVFVSRFGAIQVQSKIPDDPYGRSKHFSDRPETVIWNKEDAYGDDVWHDKNKA
ncbi:MAG TPA: hypothetical protein VG965_05080 [Patescibacteria group bacterium]|nr:hypothetical protein [Patescibacteria group bacterium]